MLIEFAPRNCVKGNIIKKKWATPARNSPGLEAMVRS